MTRRFFIGGSFAFGAFGGCRMFSSSHPSCLRSDANLRFGVISDVHLLGRNAAPLDYSDYRGDETVFRQALEWYRDRGVDAVMIAGDIADYGMVDELKLAMDVWNDVFPDGRAPDGRKVEKLIVTGNHEVNGFRYDDYARRKYPSDEDFRRHVLRADLARYWEEFVGEPYERFSRKEVRGYVFLSTHWGDGADRAFGYCKKGNCGEELDAWLQTNGKKKIDPNRPFFYFQHAHLKDTCFAPWCFDTDRGRSTAALSAWPNAVTFAGHAHYSATDERAIWQGAFTAISVPSLRFVGLPTQQYGDFGYENSYCNWPSPKERAGEAMKTTDPCRPGGCPQGLLVDVFDDRMVVSRLAFPSGASLGDDWTVPLTPERPYSYAARRRKSVAPQFAKDAMVACRRVRRRTRGENPTVKDAVEIVFPPAVDGGSRVFEYEVSTIGAAGVRKTFNLLASGCDRPLADALAKAENRMSISVDRLPPDMVRIDVTPKDCWQNHGQSISAVVESFVTKQKQMKGKP